MENPTDVIDPVKELAGMAEAHPEAMSVMDNLRELHDRVGYAGVFIFLTLLQETLESTVAALSDDELRLNISQVHERWAARRAEDAPGCGGEAL